MITCNNVLRRAIYSISMFFLLSAAFLIQGCSKELASPVEKKELAAVIDQTLKTGASLLNQDTSAIRSVGLSGFASSAQNAVVVSFKYYGAASSVSITVTGSALKVPTFLTTNKAVSYGASIGHTFDVTSMVAGSLKVVIQDALGNKGEATANVIDEGSSFTIRHQASSVMGAFARTNSSYNGIDYTYVKIDFSWPKTTNSYYETEQTGFSVAFEKNGQYLFSESVNNYTASGGVAYLKTFAITPGSPSNALPDGYRVLGFTSHSDLPDWQLMYLEANMKPLPPLYSMSPTAPSTYTFPVTIR